MRNMQSKLVQILAAETIHIKGDVARQSFYFQLEKQKDYEVALAPLGTVDPTPFFVPVVQATGTLTQFNHIGEIFVKNTGGAAAGIALASDEEMVVEHNYTT